MTFVLVGLQRSGNFSLRSVLIKIKRNLALQALFPLCRGLRPVREVLRKFRSLGLPPPLLPALQEGRIRREGLRVHLVLCPVRLPLLPLDLGLARGGGVSLDVRPLSVSTPLSLQLLRELESGGLLSRSGLPLPAPLPRLLLPAHHSTLGNVMSREKFRWTTPFLDPPVFPDLRIEEQGRIVELALGRTALVTVAVLIVFAPLTVRSQAVESVGGGHPLGRCPPASGRDLRIAPGACALALRETALGMTGRGLLTATDPVDSVRVPLLARELTMTGSLVVLVTARGLVDDLLPPLTNRDQRREDSEPDVSGRRVWRRLLSPRLLLSLKCLL